MKAVILAFLFTINNSLVRTITFDPKFVPKILEPVQNLVSSAIKKGDSFDPQVFPDMLKQLPDEQIGPNIDKIIKSGQSAELKEALRLVPLDKALKPAIQLGDNIFLQDLLTPVSNADLSSYIVSAAVRQRPDMVLTIAKHGNPKTLSFAIYEICTKMKNPKAFLSLLLRETKHIPGSVEVTFHAYKRIISDKYGNHPSQKYRLISTFISSSTDNIVAEEMVKLLSVPDKKNLLLFSTERGYEGTVRLLAATPDNLPFDRSLAEFAKLGSWDFIFSLSKYRPGDVCTVIISLLPKQYRPEAFKELLKSIGDQTIVPVFRSVAKSGELDLLPLVWDKLKNEILMGGQSLTAKLSSYYKMYDPKFFSPLYESHPVPKDWTILDGIHYASTARQNRMVATLLSELGNVAVAGNLPLKYAVLYRDSNLVQILLKDRRVLQTGLDDTMRMADELMGSGRNRNELFEIYRQLEVAKYSGIFS